MLEPISIKYMVYIAIVFFSSVSIYFLWIGFTVTGRTHRVESNNATGGILLYESFVNEAVRKRSELYPKPLMGGRVLTQTASHIAMSNIEYLTKVISTHHKSSRPYLFGINKGGSLIANYVAHRLGLHENYLVKCDWDPLTKRENFEDKEVDGPIIILDDVSRSGRTLDTVRKILESKYPEASIYCMVLVVTRADDVTAYSSQFTTSVNYAAWYTAESHIQLPWSLVSEDGLNVAEYFEDEEMDQVGSRFSMTH